MELVLVFAQVSLYHKDQNDWKISDTSYNLIFSSI